MTRDSKKAAAAWIETTHRPHDNCTEWRVIVDGEVAEQGDVSEDVSGSRAYAEAQAWSETQSLAIAGWKHAIDRGMGDGPARSRTTTGRATPMLLYGWAKCAEGGREPVAVFAQQMRALEDGELPCPCCGEGCGATIEPSNDEMAIALAWNGTRWHMAPRT